MNVISKKDIYDNVDFYLSEIKCGKIFIYPTDTIYGIGCNALNSKSVSLIREIKKRDGKAFSVIAPSKNWIYENCRVLENHKNYVEKLPGKYTFIFELKFENSIAKNEVILDKKGLGVRIPDHWFSQIISKSSVPFVTSSANISGENNIIEIKKEGILLDSKIDYIIDDGKWDGKASKVIDLREEKEVVLRE
ncbi:MAG: threonylcarbamoyl-AMP synthase [Nanoarchaeota archaeon]|nr:threonylcarbamoyl-AMP synthase [Nanoarchaeota archaeon]